MYELNKQIFKILMKGNVNTSIIITFIVNLSCFTFSNHKSSNKRTMMMYSYTNKIIYKVIDKEHNYSITMNYLLYKLNYVLQIRKWANC